MSFMFIFTKFFKILRISAMILQFFCYIITAKLAVVLQYNRNEKRAMGGILKLCVSHIIIGPIIQPLFRIRLLQIMRQINLVQYLLCLEIKTVADSQRLDYAEITKAILKDFQWSSESVLLRKLNHMCNSTFTQFVARSSALLFSNYLQFVSAFQLSCGLLR